MLSSRRFYVELNNECSIWEKTEERPATGKCPVPIHFNIYTNDQPLHNGTRSLIYADDLYVTAQQPSFVEVKTTIEESMSELTQYYRSNNLRENPCYGIPPEEQRGEENVKGEMEQDRSGEHTTS